MVIRGRNLLPLLALLCSEVVIVGLLRGGGAPAMSSPEQETSEQECERAHADADTDACCGAGREV